MSQPCESRPSCIPLHAVSEPTNPVSLPDSQVSLAVNDKDELPIGITAAAKALTIHLPALKFLVDAGVVKEADMYRSGNRRYVWLGPKDNLRDLFDRWSNCLPPLVTIADFDMYSKARRLCRVRIGEPHPTVVLEAVRDYLVKLGHITPHELSALIKCDHASSARVIAWIRKSMRTQRWLKGVQEQAPVSFEMFQNYLPKELTRAPETAADPRDGELYAAPEPDVLGRLCTFKRLFETASLAILLVAAYSRRPKTVRPYVVALERLDALFEETDRDPSKASNWLDLLNDYAAGDKLGHGQSNWIRWSTITKWQSLYERMQTYLASLRDNHLSRQIARHVPEKLEQSKEFEAAVERLNPDRQARWAAGRLKSAGRLSDSIHQVLPGLRTRVLMVSTFSDAAWQATERLVAEVETASSADFAAEIDILDERSIQLPGKQVIYGRVWRTEAICHDLVSRAAKGAELPARGRRPGPAASGEPSLGRTIRDFLARRNRNLGNSVNKATCFSSDFQYEYLGTFHPTTGQRAPDPWFIKIFESAILMRPGSLSVAAREKRHAFMREWKAPSLTGTPPQILSPNCDASLPIRLASELPEPALLMPLFAFDHAMRAAFLTLSVQLDTGFRGHQALQITDFENGASGWDLLKEKGEEYLAIRSIPKQTASGHHPRDVTNPYIWRAVSDRTLEAVISLKQVILRRGGGTVQLSNPQGDNAWKCDPDRYLLAWNGKMFSVPVINHLMRVLACGIAYFASHDVRNVAANVLRARGASDAEIAEFLGNTPRVARWYGQLTAGQEQALLRRDIGAILQEGALFHYEG